MRSTQRQQIAKPNQKRGCKSGYQSDEQTDRSRKAYAGDQEFLAAGEVFLPFG